MQNVLSNGQWRDKGSSVVVFGKLSELEDSNAMFLIGWSDTRGEGVATELIQAFSECQCAADCGDQDTIENREVFACLRPRDVAVSRAIDRGMNIRIPMPYPTN